MRGCTPCEKTLETVLEDKDYSNPVPVSAALTRNLRRVGTIYLALNRRKLFVIKGREKLGLLMYFDERTSGGKSSSSISSSGMTC